jgi:hypothetical protein
MINSNDSFGMETIFLQPNTPIPAEPCVATVGFFDGDTAPPVSW